MREALYGLDYIAAAISLGREDPSLMATMEREMVANPANWSAHYSGHPARQRALRHFSYSDRIRYYWASPAAGEAVQRLFAYLGETGIPAPLLSQFLPRLYPRVSAGSIPLDPRAMVVEAIRDVLRRYAAACRSAPERSD